MPRKKKADAPPETPETVLVLRTCKADWTSHEGFTWPQSGPVEAPDWAPTKECGNGLHGWLWGHGNWKLKARGEGIHWLVVEVEKASVIDLDGKVKFPRGAVIATFGHWADAMAFIRSRRPEDDASATGNYGHASATGNSGHASATGYSGHASATGNYGHASATGESGWAIAGYNGKVRADKNGVLTALFWDAAAGRPRVLVGYVGEAGIEAHVWYRVLDATFVKVEEKVEEGA